MVPVTGILFGFIVPHMGPGTMFPPQTKSGFC